MPKLEINRTLASNEVTLRSLDLGDVFRKPSLPGAVFMKLGLRDPLNSEISFVNLRTGYVDHESQNTMVIPMSGTLDVKDA